MITTKKLKKTKQLKNLLNSSKLEFLMEAHNGMSAKITQKIGFKGIWASGLAISTRFAVRDANEVSWTQVTDLLEFMSDATQIPILLDGDTGYGNFNNFRRLVKKLELRDIAGVCIEDKCFPKTNSFIDGDLQSLADIGEFCGKIKAGKDTQIDSDFCIIARVEALIAGWGLRKALERAEAYRRAGADAILIHSKQSTADEVIQFSELWADRCPLLIVPTKYYNTPTDLFRKSGISCVIWANQMLRASLITMEKIGKEIYSSESINDVEQNIASLSKVFDLQEVDELQKAQKQYFNS